MMPLPYSTYCVENIYKVIEETEEVLSETHTRGNREQLMIDAYREIAQLYRIDKEVMKDERDSNS